MTDFLKGLNLEKLITLLLLLAGCLVVMKLVLRLTDRAFLRLELERSLHTFIHAALRVILWMITLCIVLDYVGVPMTSLVAVLSVIGLAVSLAIQGTLSNLAGGIQVLLSKPFKAGDFIEVEGDSGVIREIEMMHTYLDTPGNMRVAIPNTKMMTATITNYSTYETRRQDLTFTISYEDNLLEAMAALQQLLDTHPQVLREPEEPIVRVKEQADCAIVLLARFWCANADYWNLQYDLLQQVKLTFDDKGISIPFPQMDVHVK